MGRLTIGRTLFDWMRLDSALKKSSPIYLDPKNLDTLIHWMSVKLPDNFQIREHSWPCLFRITCIKHINGGGYRYKLVVKVISHLNSCNILNLNSWILKLMLNFPELIHIAAHLLKVVLQIKKKLNITFYQRTLLGTSANQKRHYLKSYNKCYYSWEKYSQGDVTSWYIQLIKVKTNVMFGD